MNERKDSEVELAKCVVAWLMDQGWTVYQEVEVFERGARADIVAVIEPKLWVIEVKRTHGLGVLEQAINWRSLSHYVSVAVPKGKRGQRTQFRQWVHTASGIGWLSVGIHGVEEYAAPQMNRLADVQYIRRALCEEQKTWCEAGNQHGYYTSFNHTRAKVLELLKDRPGLTMKEIFEDLGRCHYCSTRTAATALSAWVRRGVVNEIEPRRDGRYVRYYPKCHEAISVDSVPSVAQKSVESVKSVSNI